jgi:hypothetical protein
MRKIASGMVSVALLLGANGAFAQEFGAKGTPAISVDRLFGFSFNHENIENPAPVGDVDTDGTHFGFGWPGPEAPNPYDIPRAAFDYFVMDSFSIGGALGYASLSLETDPGPGQLDATAFVFAPRAGYVWNLNDWASFWLRGGFTYHSYSIDDGPSEHALALTVEPTFVLSPAQHWGIVAGPTADLSFSGEREQGNADVDLTYTSWALVRAGMIGWF